MHHERSQRPWCVIGAGPSGLTALKNLLAAGLPAECLEREDALGGNWDFNSPASSLFASTRLISSKTLTAYTDFPMPRQWPAYPDHRQCLEYLRNYARHFDLLPHIRRCSVVERIEPAPQSREASGGWIVHATGRAAQHYAGVVIATGHNRVPRFPTQSNAFSGILLHACEYKSPTQPVAIAGKRVLVIGGGNSGCDIAAECAQHAGQTVHSTRRGYFVVPRLLFGRPADLRSERLLKLGLPLWLRRWISLRAIDRTIGLPHRHGLARPDHKLWQTHPVVNDELYRQIKAGRIRPAADIKRIAGATVEFQDGHSEAFDVVICATGYQLSLPFIAAEHLCVPANDDCPRLYLNLLHPSRDDIAAVGLIQPDSGQWGLTDLQSQLVAHMASAAQRVPRAAAWLYRQRQQPRPTGTSDYLDSPRHRLEVEHFAYRKQLLRLIAGMQRRSESSGVAGLG